jgi:putative transposase
LRFEWRQSSPDQKIGLQLEEEAAMKKSARRIGREQSINQLHLPLPELLREALFDTVMVAGLGYVGAVLEEERSALCGLRYRHNAARQALRAGSVASSLTLGGQRVGVARPRVRSLAGHELTLPSWQAWSARDPLDQRAMEQMVLGVSRRRYARSLEPLPGEFCVHGTGKSAVSKRFVLGTARKLGELLRRDLRGLELVALMIDGVHFADHVVLTAIGIDREGAKHPLGLREGATENASACRALLSDLIERGLNPERAILVVLDGAKALHKAVREVFGERALIHRCHAHKKPNVLEALPQRLRGAVHTAMNQAYATRDAKRAQRLLTNLAHRLESAYPSAAASVREGLEETLTVMRLHLPKSLERVLSSTNLIENLFSRVREVARRVKRWQGGMMILRWTAAGVLEAERHLRKVAGFQSIPKLSAALRAHDAAINRRRGVDNRQQAA